MDKLVFIYALTDPRNDEVKYIGSSTNPGRRYGSHFSSKQSNRLKDWIDELVSQDKWPGMVVLEKCPLEQRETMELWWMDYYHDEGCRLLNSHGYRTIHGRPRLKGAYRVMAIMRDLDS